MRTRLHLGMFIVALAGCASPPPSTGSGSFLRFTLVPSDWWTDVGSQGSPGMVPPASTLAVYWDGEVDEDASLHPDEYLPGALSLVSIATGRRVEGSVLPGVHRHNGEAFVSPDGAIADAFSFVPAEPLEDGWYVLALDLTDWRLISPDGVTFGGYGTYVEEGKMYARVHVGARPTWYMSYVGCGSYSGCTIGVVWSEPVPDVEPSTFAIEADGRPFVGCGLSTRAETNIWWRCPYSPEGTELTIRLVEADVIHPISDGAVAHSIINPGDQSVTSYPVEPRFGIDITNMAE